MCPNHTSESASDYAATRVGPHGDMVQSAWQRLLSAIPATVLCRRREGITEHLARQGTRGMAIFHQDRAIDDRMGNALGPFTDAPAIVREVMDDVFWQGIDGIGIKDDQICSQARA